MGHGLLVVRGALALEFYLIANSEDHHHGWRRLVTRIFLIVISSLFSLTLSASAISPAVVDQKEFTGPVIIPVPNSYRTAKGGKMCVEHFEAFRELVVEAGLEPRMVTMPIGRIYSSIETSAKLFHVWVATRGDFVVERMMSIEPTVIPDARFSLYSLPGPTPPPLENLGDISVITLLGHQVGGLLKKLKSLPNINILYAHNHASALKMLKAGRAPYLLATQLPMDLAMSKREKKELQENVILRRTVYGVVLKSVPNSKLLHARLEAASRRIVAQWKKGEQQKENRCATE